MKRRLPKRSAARAERPQRPALVTTSCATWPSVALPCRRIFATTQGIVGGCKIKNRYTELFVLGGAFVGQLLFVGLLIAHDLFLVGRKVAEALGIVGIAGLVDLVQ